MKCIQIVIKVAQVHQRENNQLFSQHHLSGI